MRCRGTMSFKAFVSHIDNVLWGNSTGKEEMIEKRRYRNGEREKKRGGGLESEA